MRTQRRLEHGLASGCGGRDDPRDGVGGRGAHGGGGFVEKSQNIQHFEFGSARTDEAALLLVALPSRPAGDGVEILEEQVWLSTETEEFLAWSRPAGAPGSIPVDQAHKQSFFVASVPLFFSPGFDVTWRVLARTRDKLVVTYELKLSAAAIEALPAVASAKTPLPAKAADTGYAQKVAAFQAEVLAKAEWLASLPDDERGEAYGKMKEAALGDAEGAPSPKEVTP